MKKIIFTLAAMSCLQAVQPNTQGYLQVSEKHQIYYETYGNSAGTPVVILHGGPGAGCKKEYTQFFDLSAWHVVMFDQRGAMRSIPFASMEENTPEHSIADIEALRKHLNITKWAVFGNSWGSCLALLYGQAHPGACLGFFLEGTFLGREQDIGIFDELKGKLAIEDLPRVCHTQLMDPNPDVHMAMAKEIMRCLIPDPAILEKIDDRYMLSVTRAIIHYAYHKCFLKPNAVIDNMHKINHIPGFIVHGSLDTVNLPRQAHTLHENWKSSQLFIVDGAGHSCFEPAIAKQLLEVTQDFNKQYSK